MSYAPNPTRIRSATRESASTRGGSDRLAGAGSRGARGQRASATVDATRATPRGRPYEEPRDWGKIALVVGGVAAGAAIGAGLALLFTDETGPERRMRIAKSARRFGHDAEQRWEDLAFELKEAARSARDKFRLRRERKQAADDEIEADD